MTDREPRRRAVTPEWAAHVTDDLTEIKAQLARLLAHHGLDAGQTPNTVTHDPDRGVFLPGTGWYPNHQPQPEPPADPDTMHAWLGRAREAIKRSNEGGE